MTNAATLLLLSSTPPGDASVGAIYLRDLCRTLAPGSIASFHPVYRGHTADPSWSLDSVSSCGPSASVDVEGSADELDAIADRVVAFAREQLDIEHAALWTVLDSPISYELSIRVCDRLGLPMLVTVWDPPDHVAHTFQVAEQPLRDGLARVLPRAASVAVVGETMRDRYASLYGVDSTIVRQGVDREQWMAPLERPAVDGRLRIGFAGSLIARPTWSAFLEALDAVAWRVCGRQVELHLFGLEPHVIFGDRPHIFFEGWAPMEEAVPRLRDVDLCYLPSWFDAEGKEAALLCFPSKLGTYLASGRPIFAHAAEYSAPGGFISRHGGGLVCGTLEPTSIIATLERIVGDDAEFARLAHSGRSILASELDLDVFRRQFAVFLDAGLD